MSAPSPANTPISLPTHLPNQVLIKILDKLTFIIYEANMQILFTVELFVHCGFIFFLVKKFFGVNCLFPHLLSFYIHSGPIPKLWLRLPALCNSHKRTGEILSTPFFPQGLHSWEPHAPAPACTGCFLNPFRGHQFGNALYLLPKSSSTFPGPHLHFSLLPHYWGEYPSIPSYDTSLEGQFWDFLWQTLLAACPVFIPPLFLILLRAKNMLILKDRIIQCQN